MALQPLGPLPASTYWRRRAVVLGVLLVAVLLVAKACGPAGPSARKDALVAPPAPSQTPSASPSMPSAGPSAPVPSDSATAPAAPSSSAAPAAPAQCSDAALAVSASTDAPAYKAGAAPRFTLTVRNTGATCQRALGPGAVELQVLSGADRIWSSDDCATSRAQDVMTLPAHATRATTVQWSGRRSLPGCRAGGTAQPGTYRVTVRIGTLFRQVAVFDITS